MNSEHKKSVKQTANYFGNPVPGKLYLLSSWFVREAFPAFFICWEKNRRCGTVGVFLVGDRVERYVAFSTYTSERNFSLQPYEWLDLGDTVD